MMRYLVMPYVRLLDGNWSLPDKLIAWTWADMVAHGRDRTVFYGGKVQSAEELQAWLQDEINTVIFVVDAKEKRLCLLAWINGLFPPGGAMLHFTALGEFKKGAADAAIEWFKAAIFPETGEPILNVLLGLTPAVNRPVVRAMRAWGFQTMEIPNLCYIAEQAKTVPGVLGALNLR